MSDSFRPIVDFAEVFNTGTNPRVYLKQKIKEKLGFDKDYVIINDNNIFFLLDNDTKEQIKTFDIIFLDLSQNPFLQEKVDHYKSLLVRPTQHMYVIVGDANFLDKTTIDTNVTYYYSEFFHTWYSDIRRSYKASYSPTIKFSSLNSVPRIQRIIFVNELHRQQLTDDVLLSFLYNMQQHHKDWVNDNHYFKQDAEKFKEEYEFFLNNIASKCPIKLEHDPEYSKFVQDYTTDSPAYSNTALNVITETTYDQQFFTEKTWKPIMANQLFLMVSAPGSIARLREFGFDTFDDLIDHSYDKEACLATRIKMVVDEMKRLSPNIFKIYANTETRRIYNQSHLKSLELESKIGFIQINRYNKP